MFYDNMIGSIVNSINFSSTKAPKTAPAAPYRPVLNNSLSFDTFVKSNMPKKNNNQLSICYYSDTHGNSDSIATMVQGIKNFRQKNVGNSSFILSAGDNVSGGDIEKNSFIEDLMQNIMGVDVSAIGNHEIDASSKGFYDASNKKNIQFVATNVKLSPDNKMNDFVKKSIVMERNGVKYGFVGTMPLDLVSCTKDEVRQGVEVMDFDESVKSIQNEVDNLKSQGINRIIMLSHVGYDMDKNLVQNLDGVDIVIGGHTHLAIDGAKDGENLLKSKSGEPVLVAQAGENGKYYGIADIEFSDNGTIKKVSNKLYNCHNREKSPVIEYIKNQNLGQSPKVGILKEADPLPENRRIEPCGWTLTMADSMKSELGTQLAIINSANIRKVPKNGILTARDIQESAPMKNKLIKAEITQKQLVDAVKNAALQTFSHEEGTPGLLQGSGFGYKIDDKGNLLEMNLIDENGNKTPIDINNPSDEIKYLTAYDDFTSKADGETPELTPRFGVETLDYDKDTTMINYLSKMPDKDNLKIINDNRIEIVHTR